MEVQRYYFGFAAALLDGALTFQVTDSDGFTYAATLTGEYYPGNLTDTGGNPAGSHEAFATALQTALNAAAVAAGSSAIAWVVSFDNATLGYAIIQYDTMVPTSGWTYTLSTWMARVLGRTTVSGTASSSSISSQVRPWFLIVPHIDAVTNPSEQDPRGAFSETVTDGGLGFGIGPSKVAREDTWTQQYEPDAATRAHRATSIVPFTWEHAFVWCRHYVPFLVVDSLSASISYAVNVVGRWKLTAEGAAFAPRRSDGRRDTYWDVPIRCRRIEIRNESYTHLITEDGMPILTEDGFSLILE